MSCQKCNGGLLLKLKFHYSFICSCNSCLYWGWDWQVV